jgi:hypothetical protein
LDPSDGKGEPRKLPTRPLDYQIGGFFPDGNRILLVASAPASAAGDREPLRTYVQDAPVDNQLVRKVRNREARAIECKGSSATLPDAIAITPDGRFFVARTADGQAVLCPVSGGDPAPIRGFQAGDAALVFTDARHLLVGRFRELPMTIIRLDRVTGERLPCTEIRSIQPDDKTGVETLSWVSVTPNLRAYGYSYMRRQCDLYLVDGLR